jgi:hypothetical protein
MTREPPKWRPKPPANTLRENLERRIAWQDRRDGKEVSTEENYERAKRICEKSENEKREGDRPR